MIDTEFVNIPGRVLADKSIQGFILNQGESVASVLTQLGPDLEVAARHALQLSRFTAKEEEIFECVIAGAERAVHLLLAGTGRSRPDALSVERAGACAYRAVCLSGSEVLELHVPGQIAELAARAAFGACLAAYRFDKYRTTETPDRKPTIRLLRVLTETPAAAAQAYRTLAAEAQAIYFARDLVSEPPNVLFPAEFAARARALEAYGLEVEVLGVDAMRRLKMDALLGVGQGSARESQLVVLRWNGTRESEAPLGFVGKGVCFDSGGLTLKEGTPMVAMKQDMAGAAAVAGLMQLLATRKARVNAVGVLALVENMPDGNALRPSDIVASMSGQTIEIISTDAEGRLILADALWYCHQRYQPRLMVDVATLTGAVHAALGAEYAGIFSNNDLLAQQLLSASELEGEPLWRLPMPAKHGELMKSLAADVKNHTDRLLGGGGITGALFLQRFVADCPWAHIDMAGTAWFDPSTRPTVPNGASGFGVRLLNRLISEHFEPS